jgi:NADH dehydrogenase
MSTEPAFWPRVVSVPSKPRVIVVGAGFGGFAAVKALKDVDAEVVLIDRTNHHLFQPLLYQVATAALSPADIATASRALLRSQSNATILLGEVTGVDAANRYVRLRDGPDIAYDYLVLATGAAYSFFGHDDWAAHTLVLKSLENALAIRDRLLAAFELAETLHDPAEQASLLSFVVVGAGPTGVELAGTIAELARATLARDFRRIDPKAARIILCEAGDRVLSAFPDSVSHYASEALAGLGVTVRLNAGVENIDSSGLTVAGERLGAATILWCAGTAARPVAKWLHAPAARNGAVRVDANCSVPGIPNVYAIGDVASYATADGKALPGLAAVAKQQGTYVRDRIGRAIRGRSDQGPFRYRNLGAMAVIGRSRAVADFGRFRLTGMLAWLAWSFVHLMLLVDFRSRVSVYMNWAWSFFTFGRGARLIYAAEPALVRNKPRAGIARPDDRI